MKEYYIESKNNMINVIEGDDVEDCKAVMLHIHGLGTHFQFICDTHDALINRDKFYSYYRYKTFGFEFSGHGKSKGSRCVVYNFNDLIDDLQCVLNLIHKSYSNKKVFLVGESMGGAVIIKYIAEKFHDIAGIILLSPMCGIDEEMVPTPFMVNLLHYTSLIFPLLPYNMNKNITENSITNESYKIAYYNNKYTYRGNYPLCTLREMYNTSIIIPSYATEIDVPILIIHGRDDNITKCSISVNFFNSITHQNKKLILINGKGHNMLVPKTQLDTYPQTIYNDILDWIDNNTSDIIS
jgi:alpha-beta hydrolase superfamily lysophospholipase